MYRVADVLLIAWLLGWIVAYELGSFIPVLLLVAIAVLFFGLLSRRRTLA